MAVYTHLGAEELARLIAHYDVGELVSSKGIAEGVSNSNWLVETTRGRFILTMYERRIETADLPFFLGLLDHLSAARCAVPRTIHDRDGAAWRMVGDKAVALIEFLPGVSPSNPTPAQARAVGVALAQAHLAAHDFPMARENTLAPSDTLAILTQCGAAALATIDPHLPAMLESGEAIVREWPEDLPRSIIHSDLFPDNVLMLDDRVTGMIDFYFACTGAMAYDLAVTHAAWCFDDAGETCDHALGRALIEGYESVRVLSEPERTALPLLAEGACLRFIASRAQDWLDTPEEALVRRKDPMDFTRRLEFYRANGQRAFA
ncbi:MAG: homoserine kinase [Erythrobacter sp.]|uniref:homoserine kinase n=1 Tax=Qipengyuania citrea TaxID=225971 RepID=UPI000BD01A9D|nr:homoserine kinase [Erythrobacter sp.]MCP2017199.1 homoserine kinase type II [Qipengyuania citrea]MDE0901298.1 homoserine kinase [Erythrobacter sp.]PCH76109.1 MAG: homoserine kinase [Erythrobacteraceae bacterium]